MREGIAGLAAASALAAALLGGCASLSGPPLRVGVSPDYPPVIHYGDGDYRGLEADMARELASDLGVGVEFVPMTFRELIPALISGRIDIIMSGMSMTAERERAVAFSDPYMRVGQMALVRAEDAAALATASRLLSTRSAVGYQKGTTGEMFVRGRLFNATFVPLDDAAAGLEALRAKRIDYFVHDAPTVWRAVTGPESGDFASVPEPLTEEFLAWAVRPWERGLLERVNRALATWNIDGRLQGMKDRWIGSRARGP